MNDLPSGYHKLSSELLDFINRLKADEERLLRKLDSLESHGISGEFPDKRWLAIARTDLEKGFMVLVRAITKPSRVRLDLDA
jgi:hypothetical protein